MTIASAFNDITEKLGGTPSNSGAIASAIDALNDVLAGSDQPAAQTIEGAVALLGEHIGTGGGDATEYPIKCYLSTDGGTTYAETESIVYEAEWSTDQLMWVKKNNSQPITKSVPGVPLAIDNPNEYILMVVYGLGDEDPNIPTSMSGSPASFVMPINSIVVKITSFG